MSKRINQLGYICIFVRVPELAVRCQRYTSYTTGQQDRDLVLYQEIEGGSKREEVIFCKYVLQLGFAFFLSPSRRSLEFTLARIRKEIIGG